MSSLAITIGSGTKKTVIVEMDADKLERVASSLGMYNPDFVASVERAEKDYRAGRTQKIRSLKELNARKK